MKRRPEKTRAIRAEREAHPERFCGVCLWSLKYGPCPKHGEAQSNPTTERSEDDEDKD